MTKDQPEIMSEITKTGVCSLLRLVLLVALLTDMLAAAASGISLPAWTRINLTIPSARWPCAHGRAGASVWLDQESETVWMFGGQGGHNESSLLIDLWKLDLPTLEWTEVQQERAPWPGKRSLSVACRRHHEMFLVGGTGSSGFQESDVWKYDLKTSTWETFTHQEDLPLNGIRFWCNGTELFGLAKHNSSSVEFLKYNYVSDWSWNRRLIHGGPMHVQSQLAPDLKNLSYYPLWPSEDNIVVIHAPIKHYKIIIENDETQQPCLLWMLTKSFRWRPLVTDCELYQTCPRLPPNLRTTETIRGLPSCRTHSAAWTDAVGNLWMYGGMSRGGLLLQDMWVFNKESRSWAKITSPCIDSQEMDCRVSPGPVKDAMTWRVNGTLFLFGGQVTSDTSNATFLQGLWTLDLSAFNDQLNLPIGPLAIFFIALSGTIFLSLISCGLIIFAKCTSPLAPRIRPPVRLYDKVHYSPVGSTDAEP